MAFDKEILDSIDDAKRPVNSSFIKSIGSDQGRDKRSLLQQGIGAVTGQVPKKTLAVEIRGDTYYYFDVPQNVVRAFEQAGSKGQFFNRMIKGKYDYMRKWGSGKVGRRKGASEDPTARKAKAVETGPKARRLDEVLTELGLK